MSQPPLKKPRLSSDGPAASGDFGAHDHPPTTLVPRDSPVVGVQSDAATSHGLQKECNTASEKTQRNLLFDIPLDIWYEICTWLTPEDLLHLVRTCKLLRKDLLTRKKQSLWARARGNIEGLPDRPPSMSEPAFAHFLFSTDCAYCGAPYSWKLMKGHLLRLCKDCFLEHTYMYSTVYWEHANLEPITNYCNGHWFDDCVPIQDCDTRQPCECKLNRILKCDVEELQNQVKVFAAAGHITGTCEDEDKDEATVHAFVDELRDKLTERIEETNDILNWVSKRDRQIRSQHARARQERFETICARLEDLGWRDELAFLDIPARRAMAGLPEVNHYSMELTENAWQGMLPALTQFLEGVRKRLQEKRYRETLRARMATLDKAIVAHYVPTLPRTARMDCRPHPIDFALEPKCRAIMDAPVSETVTVEQFAPLIPGMASKWEADRRQALLDYILPHLGEVAAGVDPLQLAISCFMAECPWYWLKTWADDEPMRYPDILALDRGRDKGRTLRAKHAPYTRPEDEDDYTYAVKTLHWNDPEPLESPRFDNEYQVPHNLANLVAPDLAKLLVDSFRSIVSALGFDPARATFDDVQQCGKWLRCMTCEREHPEASVTAWTWLEAARHDRAVHSCVTEALDRLEDESTGTFMEFCITVPDAKTPAQWQVVDEEDMVRMRAMLNEDEEAAVDNHDQAPFLSCSLCRDFDARERKDRPDMTKHVREV
ncbi:hypothetical protein C8Q77DRAFT_1138114 [Trametes polyzona]|nr:hypothetical protein C8Q77DRAFT_1138114 [Trametes polyzona]